ncbi:transmembrane protein [Amycolatopsis mediterranei S699]|uniref:Transmembrane protein n=2 Tax=Amycolatopsis mediterranei TaxID=33910 RepID=A0A9R0P2J9_AMYMS|nr:RidA family protein [Amycolatopsis mediterranei]ADJ48255.1 putative transmembrane protein [Amycolatopsis mediterranei U32]AEK45166.1 transmembrane protein [Amycolatopsis mediterranei S699]AFO79966.1 transmembrane protein [Amycolatopsis mediterranei S699]AGT87094.1 transmembrane protein [Amycolatopsis mediterranei RB]KDO10410.1 membrane protein [Amycolatopsis mediterranei]
MTTYPVEIPSDSAVFGQTTGGFERFGYSPAVRAHNHLFIAGQIGSRPDGTVPDTIEEQTERALLRIEEILRLEKLELTSLVDITSYHVDIHQHLPGFLDVKKRFVNAPYPAWSMIGISGLARPEFLIEIKATAAYPR